ncbi:sensor histidine kinase [Microvirga puerhi]|uniref:histidine kinase n=1 Tax=Microvirga puerhi TaxID=2876078 RepID=A0ABS7VTI1_9HYPH|nr:HAMP domain-containing sensor histidine kinase [Microvirga puerhi]MBZ6078869.1 HAMP domain-containing histidine kinase [Microvirga puerhi]
MIGPRLSSLRWRLVLAFLLVSAPPVLGASYFAAKVISAAFQHNVERWLEETAHFLALDTEEAKDEADKSAAIIVTTLESRKTFDPEGLGDFVAPFADLLASVGYDYVQIYDDDGRSEYTFGQFTFLSPPPKEASKSLYRVQVNGGETIVGGAVRVFSNSGKRHFVFVANAIDEAFFAASQASKTLQIRIPVVNSNGAVAVRPGQAGPPFEIPAGVLQSLLQGAQSAVSSGTAQVGPATAFAALRDEQGHLVAIVACRVAGMAAMFERLTKWQYFLALAGIAGLFSVLVGALVAERITRPLRALIEGVRAVTAGDYRSRVQETGGHELAELATGFNLMNEQLDRLRSKEGAMRKREQLATLGEAAAVLAHEIRNPLGIIKTSSQLVRMKSALNASEDRLIGFVLDEVSRIDRLVRDLLDFARPKEMQKSLIDFRRDVLERAIDFAAPELAKRGLTWTISGPNGSAKVFGDPDRLYQTVLNLILNAMDATEGGGTLTATMNRRAHALELKLEDDGVGIAPEVIGRIFDPFFTTKAKGTGLGLAQAKAAVEEHGGSLTCASTLGRGTAFIVELPLPELEHADETICSGR